MSAATLTRAQQATRARLAAERTAGRAALDAVKRALREPYAWPGGYAVQIVMRDGEMICGTCARENFRLVAAATLHDPRDSWAALGSEIYWEGPRVTCCHCGAGIESEYGDPQE